MTNLDKAKQIVQEWFGSTPGNTTTQSMRIDVLESLIAKTLSQYQTDRRNRIKILVDASWKYLLTASLSALIVYVVMK